MEEQGIWRRLFERLENPLTRYASKEYLDGVDGLGLHANEWPNFLQLSKRLENASGWKITAVAGFLNEYIFFKLNTNREFPATDIIRQSDRFKEKYAGQEIQNKDEYTPEPDIFHDVRGHLPFFMNKEYGDFLWEVGALGLEILEDKRGLGPELVAHNMKRLQNFAWWSYEFGVMKKQPDSHLWRVLDNDSNHEIYGAGILSSFDEVMNVVNCSKGISKRSTFLPFDLEEIILTRFDYSDIQDRYYVIDSMQQLYSDYRSNIHLFFFEG